MIELHAIAEMPERDAPPAIAAIYAEMREALEMPLVNLIYRHFATHAGVLPWAWSIVRPLAATGALQSLAQRLRGRVEARLALRAWAPVSDDVLAQHGLDADAARAIGELVEFYNRGNCMNVLVMKLLLKALDEPSANRAQTAEPPRRARRSARAAVQVPPIPPVGSLSDAERLIIAELNRYGEPGEPGALATLYRHAAVWPGCLGLWRSLLAPLERDGFLDQMRSFTGETAGALAAGLTPPDGLAALAPTEPRLRDTIEHFSSVTICKMIPIGLLLVRAFGSDTRDGR